MNKRTPEHPFYDTPGTIAIAHRGGDVAGVEKENSMAAFEAAVNAGITHLETDTIATADGVALAFHGSKNQKQVQRTGLPLRAVLQQMTYDETRAITIGGEPIPTLEEALDAFPNTRFFIDPKTAEAVAPLARIVARPDIQDRVSVAAFNYRRTLQVVDGNANIATAYATVGAIGMVMLGARITAPLARPYFNGTAPTSLQVPHDIVTAKMVERAQDIGLKVIVWPRKPVQNDNQAYMQRALMQGVDGLMSDHVTMLQRTIEEYERNN